MSLWCSGQGVAWGSTLGDAFFFSLSYRFVVVVVVVFFFSVWALFFKYYFSFGLFSLLAFILTADPAGHALGSIYILSISPEFYFAKGFSKVLDLPTGPSLRPEKTKTKKNISCQDMSLL